MSTDKKISFKKAVFDAEEFLKLNKNLDNNAIISKLLENIQVEENQQLLIAYFGPRIEFGTAGLRGLMAPGFSNINDLVIVQTAQGITTYIEKNKRTFVNNSILIGFDGRRNSKRWAMMSANLFIKNQIKVFLSQDVIPTPYVAFGTRYFKTSFGIMITASHNPKDYNGYKVYYNNGAQIISPIDKEISSAILENQIPHESAWNFQNIYSEQLLTDPLSQLEEAYLSSQLDSIHFNSNHENAKSKVKVVYSAMHGVGWKAVQKITKAFGFSDDFLVPFPDQRDPDEDFPTVKFPNPEEKGALNLAKQYSDKMGLNIILANDPDADRLAIAENSDSWYIFTGNELGALLGHWIWHNWRKRNPTYDLSKVYMLSSTVSSKILETIAKKEGFKFIETLTGFKWMGNEIDKLYKADSSNKVIFAFEEAIGFMCGDIVLDKDGISALAVASELIVDAYGRGKTLKDCLFDIFENYGFHISNNGYYICHEKLKIDAMFSRLRNWPDKTKCRRIESSKGVTAEYPTFCGPYEIKAIRDLTIDYDDNYPDLKARLPISSNHAMTFKVDCGVTFTLRTSGTEPKIKFYSELLTDPTSKSVMIDAEKKLAKVVTHMIEEFFQPEKNDFKPQSIQN